MFGVPKAVDVTGQVRKFGFLPDIPDHRDMLFLQTPHFSYREIPPVIDLRPYLHTPRDQGGLGACTGFALASLREFFEVKEILTGGNGRKMIEAGSEEVTKALKMVPYFSPLFIYYYERLMEGCVNEDSGAFIRDGMKVLQQKGACFEEFHPYKEASWKKKPLAKADTNAEKNQIIKFFRVGMNDLEIKQALSSYLPVVCGITIFESFMSKEVGNTGIVPMPGWSESKLGGHAVIIVGYDDNTRRYIMKNSWGTAVGDKGYFYLPYEYLRKLGSDGWSADAWE